MGPGFESQRDHKGKANRKISFSCLKILGFEHQHWYGFGDSYLTFKTVARLVLQYPCWA